jgi:CubicO group peptidase (beta-lactamase class C family)
MTAAASRSTGGSLTNRLLDAALDLSWALMMRTILALAVLCTSTFAARAQEASAACTPPAKLDDGWMAAAPAAQGFEPDRLCALDKFLGQWPAANIHSVVVVRHGKLVMERYYSGIDYRLGRFLGFVDFGPTVKHDLRSISKSVTSLLVGIALGEGKFPDLDSPLFDHLPAKYAGLRTADNSRITLRHLLTMSSGLDWDENRPYTDPENSEIEMERAEDPYRFVLQRAVATIPGLVYNYNSGGTELLALALTHSIGGHIDDYARDKLFGPLGITDFEWDKLASSGEPYAAAGVRLRPRDMAKLGQLVLNDGRWNGKQVLPKGWVAESTKPRVQGSGLYFYGYQWWLGRTFLRGRDLHWRAGVGLGGQRLFVQPDLDLVVAITAGHYTSALQVIIPLDIFARHVLPATTD